VYLAVHRQVGREPIDVAEQVATVGIEESERQDAPQIQRRAGRQQVGQAIAFHRGQEMDALHENAVDDAFEVTRRFPADGADEHDAPGREQRAVTQYQARRAGPPHGAESTDQRARAQPDSPSR